MAGRYKADRNADGTWNVRGVPVFASNRLRKVEVTKDWQERAVRKAAARFKTNGYVPPLHENHHGDGSHVRRLGAWMPKRVVKIKTVEVDEAGEPVVRESWATEADLLSIPEAEYQRIKRGDLPYVSVEANLAGEDLESLAMLPTQAPAIKLPPVTIGAEEYAAHVVTYAATSTGARTTMRFSAMMDEAKKGDEANPKAPPAAPVAPAVAAAASAAPDAAKQAEDAKPMDAKPEAPEAPESAPAAAKPAPAVVTEEAVPGWAAKLLGSFQALADMLAKAVQPSKDQPVALTAGAQGGGVVPHAAPSTETFTAKPAEAATPTSAPSADPSADTFAAINGRLAAVEGWKVAREAEDALRAQVKPYVVRCQARVPTIDADELFAAAKEKGLSYVEAYTKAVEQFGAVAPPPSLAAATGSAPALPPEVMAYHDKSPETFAAAKSASDLFDARKDLRGGMSRARWIELNIPTATTK